MRMILITMAVVLMAANVSWAGNVPSSDYHRQGVVEGRAIPHLNVRPLSSYEQSAIDRYMGHYGPKMSFENATALRQALETLVGIDQSHLPLTRTPTQYLADWQTATQLLNRTEWKVRMPAPPPAPPAPRKRYQPRLAPPAPAPQVMYLPQQAPAPMSAPLPVITGGQTVVQNAVMTASWCGYRSGNITVTATGGVGAAAAAASSSSSSASTSATPTSAAGANNGSGSSSSGASP